MPYRLFETGAPAATGTNAETTAETNAATTEKHINIRAYCNEAEAVLIEISNNGPAIPRTLPGIFSFLSSPPKKTEAASD